MRLDALAQVPADAEVTPTSLVEAGLIRAGRGPAKLLANGSVAARRDRARRQGECRRAGEDSRGRRSGRGIARPSA